MKHNNKVICTNLLVPNNQFHGKINMCSNGDAVKISSSLIKFRSNILSEN